MKIILIGFMGSGKTTVAKKLGAILNWPIVEMDELVLKKANAKNMDEVFAKGGELFLREIEIAIAKEWALTSHVIISTGGGVVLNKIILDYLKKTEGVVIFLNASFQTIENRLKIDHLRPLFKNKRDAQNLYQFRLPLYFKYADKMIEVDDKSIDTIALEIIESHLIGQSYGQ